MNYITSSEPIRTTQAGIQAVKRDLHLPAETCRALYDQGRIIEAGYVLKKMHRIREMIRAGEIVSTIPGEVLEV